jgi:hypothetical protein
MLLRARFPQKSWIFFLELHSLLINSFSRHGSTKG